MTSNELDLILADYIRANLSPRKPERDMVARRYDQLKDILSGRTFQNGSYARHTSTTPVNDLDVFYVLPESVRRLILEKRINPEELSIDNILVDLADALRKEYKEEARVDVQPHSVGIFFGSDSDFSMDVVPAQPLSDDKYLVPETALHSIRARRLIYENLTRNKLLSSLKLKWIKSDPKGYIAQATILDESTNGVFRKSAKFVKKWRQGCKNSNDKFPLKSFHIEIILTELLKANPMLGCYQSIQHFFSILPTVILHPQYPDKADPSRYIDAYVSDLNIEQRALISVEHDRATKLIGQIVAVDSESQLLKTIEELLHLTTKASNLVSVVAGTPRLSPAQSKPYRW